MQSVGTRVIVHGLRGVVVGHGAVNTDGGPHWTGEYGTRPVVLVDVGTYDVPALFLESTGIAVSIVAADPSAVETDLGPDTYRPEPPRRSSFEDEPTAPGVQ